MLLGIGVDIVHIPRIAALVSRHSHTRFARRILSSNELSDWELIRRDDQQKQVRFLAVRWAVKEAAYKALYPTIKPTWKELSYHGLTKSGEKPKLLYTSYNKEHARKLNSIHVSVSHDGDYATAFVVAEGDM